MVDKSTTAWVQGAGAQSGFPHQEHLRPFQPSGIPASLPLSPLSNCPRQSQSGVQGLLAHIRQEARGGVSKEGGDVGQGGAGDSYHRPIASSQSRPFHVARGPQVQSIPVQFGHPGAYWVVLSRVMQSHAVFPFRLFDSSWVLRELFWAFLRVPVEGFLGNRLITG